MEAFADGAADAVAAEATGLALGGLPGLRLGCSPARSCVCRRETHVLGPNVCNVTGGGRCVCSVMGKGKCTRHVIDSHRTACLLKLLHPPVCLALRWTTPGPGAPSRRHVRGLLQHSLSCYTFRSRS